MDEQKQIDDRARESLALARRMMGKIENALDRVQERIGTDCPADYLNHTEALEAGWIAEKLQAIAEEVS